MTNAEKSKILKAVECTASDFVGANGQVQEQRITIYGKGTWGRNSKKQVLLSEVKANPFFYLRKYPKLKGYFKNVTDEVLELISKNSDSQLSNLLKFKEKNATKETDV